MSPMIHYLSNIARLRSYCLRLILLISISAPQVLQAHPHNWINVKTQLLLNADNKLIEIQQSWEFDAIYSMITSASIKNTYEDESEGLALMAETMRKNLSSHSYFSNLIVDGKSLLIPTASLATLKIEQQDPISIMTLDFTLRFENPIDVKDKKVIWSVYDPTYYIAMNHKDVSDVNIIGGQDIECGKDLVIPKPTEETVAYASSLDKSNRDTDGLGDQFAERAILQCI